MSSKLVTVFSGNFMFGLHGPNNIIFLFKCALFIVSGNLPRSVGNAAFKSKSMSEKNDMLI